MISTLNLAKQNGGKVHFTSLAKGFRAQGHQVDALLATTGNPTVDYKISQHYFDRVTFTSTLLSRLIPVSKTTVNSLAQVLSALRADPSDYDWVYLRSTPLSLFVLRALQLRGFRKIFVEHNGWFADELVMMGVPNRFKFLLESLQTTEAQLATQIRVVVPGIQSKLLARSKAAKHLEAHLLVIGNGADIEHYHPINRTDAIQSVGLDPSRFYLGFIGDLDPWQGVDTAIQAMALIRKQIPQAELLVIGAGRQLESLQTQYGNLNYVHFLGTIPYDDSNRYINCFDIALLPKQGLTGIGYSPIKLYTYAATGRTILGSRLRGIEDYGDMDAKPTPSQKVEQEIQAQFIVLHEPGDVQDLAIQACRLIVDRERCDRNAARARTYAETYFSWQRIANQILEAMTNYDMEQSR